MEKTYFNARSKAKEAKLLSKESLEMLSKSASLEDVHKNLLDLKLLKGEQINSFSDLYQITIRKEKEFIEFLMKESINTDLTKFFLLDYDYFNLESLYFYIKLNYPKTKLKPQGYIKISTLEKNLMQNNSEGLSPYMKKLLDVLEHSEDKSPFFVDNLFKKTLYKEKLELSKVSKELYECVNYMSDLKNIELALRIRDEKMFSLTKIDGGSLSDEVFKNLCYDDYAKILSDSKFSSFKNVVEIIIEAKMANKPFQKFDFLMDCFPLTFFDDKKYDLNGLLPYIRYCYLEIIQTKNLKIIFDGLKIGENRKNIFSNLRRVYEKWYCCYFRFKRIYAF